MRLLKTISLLILAATMLLPFLWMVSTALMTDLEVYQFPPQFLPGSWKWSNVTEALTLQPFDRFFLNTLIVSVVSTIGQLLF